MTELEQEIGHFCSAPPVPKALKTHSGVSVAAALVALTSTPPSGDPGEQSPC